jgi:hypothetical protein
MSTVNVIHLIDQRSESAPGLTYHNFPPYLGGFGNENEIRRHDLWSIAPKSSILIQTAEQVQVDIGRLVN